MSLEKEKKAYPGMVERLVPGVNRPWGGESPMLNQHLLRYKFAAQYLHPDMAVIDLACGSGYGSDHLSSAVASVVGVDLMGEAIREASRLVGERLALVRADGQFLPFGDGSFDAAVCLETVEHVADADKLLRELFRVLRPPGVLVISTPIIPTTHFEPYHRRDFTSGQFLELLSRHRFQVWDTLVQEQSIMTAVATLRQRPVIHWPCSPGAPGGEAGR
jgi:ubiquinone/menaquinone biosynthesis C-methylase UbiE